jgi:hypothetical protein
MSLKQRTIQILHEATVGAAVSAAAVSAVAAPAAFAQQPQAQVVRTVAGQEWFRAGATDQYVSIRSDGLYGFQSTYQPAVYLDLKGSGQQLTYFAQVCRQSYTGATVACGTTAQGAYTQTHSASLSTAGTWGTTNSVWDYYYVHAQLPGASASNLLGIGSVLGVVPANA